jgi:uncharacterized OB-fold protein
MSTKWLRLKLWNYLGTEVHRTRYETIPPHMYCIDCGSRVPWMALVRRKWWTYTACPSCEDYMDFMCRENPKATEEAA